MDGRTDKPSYRDVCHIKKLIKSNPPSKKVSPLISCQSWHLFKKKIFFFRFFAIFTPIYGSLSHARLYEIFNNFCYTRVYALIFFATASVCHGLTFYEKKRVTRGVPARLFWGRWLMSCCRRSYFFVKRLHFEP